MATPSCRFCSAPPAAQSVKGKNVFGGRPDQHFWICAECGIIYLNPPLDEAEEAEFYKKDFEKFMSRRAGADMDWTGPEKHVQANQREVMRRIPVLMHTLRPGQRVLEVGCSSGFMLSALKDKGFFATGLEPSGTFIDYVRSKGIGVFRSIEELKKSGATLFDAIIHYFVLEHIRYPVDFIKEYMMLVRKGGVMVFEVPCATDPLVEVFKVPVFDDFYWSAAHHWYFTKDSLTRLLERSGFRFELYPEQRYDLSNHIAWMRDGKPGGMGRWSDIFGDDLDRRYKERLKELWLCDTMIAVVRKI